MSTNSYKVAEKLFLVRQEISKASKADAKPAAVPTNHLLVIDCSGSMSYDLPRIREQAKKKIPKLLAEQDTLSIIWFSGRGECGVLLEAEPVSTLADLTAVNTAIDRWLKPVGLTGFKDPLVLAGDVTKRMMKARPGSVCALVFMSDGWDNQWSKVDILKAVDQAAGSVASATIVEYGYCADRQLLASMAEKFGGSHIFAEDFDRYVPAVEAALQKKSAGGKRVEVKVGGDPIGGFAFAFVDGDLTTFSIEGGAVKVPEDLTEITYLSPTKVGSEGVTVVGVAERYGQRGAPYTTAGEPATEAIMAAAYASVALFSVRMKPDIVLPLLKALGDVGFIEQFGSCFGKQKYSDFMDAAKAAAFDTTKRFTKGYDPKKVPADDAFNVLDLLQLLASDETNRVLLDHADFSYNRISRGRVDANEVLNPEEQTKVTEITTKMASEKNAKKLKALQEELAALTAKKVEPLKFVQDPAPDGYPISSLVYNEDRPNISFMVRREGKVDISKHVPAEHAKLPKLFPSFTFRNYAAVKDGLVNIDKLPVRVSHATADKLSKLLPDEAKPSRMAVSKDYVEGTINLRALPVINRNMIKATNARTLFEKQFELEKAKAAQKVFKFFKDQKTPKKESASFKTTYGDDAANWLKDAGFTDYSGFSPKAVQAESTDFYMGRELALSIKGMSSLPSVKDVQARIAAKKAHTATSGLMAPYIAEVDAYLASDEHTKSTDQDTTFLAWIDKKAKASIQLSRQLISELAQIKFAINVGQVWFNDLAADENTMTLDLDGNKVECKVEMNEIQIKI